MTSLVPEAAALCAAPSMEKFGQTRVGHMQLHSHIGVLNLAPCPPAFERALKWMVHYRVVIITLFSGSGKIFEVELDRKHLALLHFPIT